MTETSAPHRRVIRSKEFRAITADAFAVRGSDHLIQLMLSLETVDFQSNEVAYLEEALLLLTPKSLKVLSIVLTNTLSILEAATGPVSLPAEKEEELYKNAGLALPKKSKE